MRIILDNDRLTLQRPDGTTLDGIRWDEIHAISAYKIDGKTRELTFIEFGFSFGEFVEINDAMDGFAEVVADLGKYIPIRPDDLHVALGKLKLSDEPIALFHCS